MPSGPPGAPRGRDDAGERQDGRFNQRPPKKDSGIRVNREIRCPEVRVIADDGAQLGIMSVPEALKVAEERGLDLVEVAPQSSPPVCRVLDFGKYKYQLKKKAQESKKNQSVVTLKEIKLRPKTDDHDLNFKIKHIRRFLGEGNKAKLTVRFRGREIIHQDVAKTLLSDIFKQLEDVATMEVEAKMDGRQMMMILAPKDVKHAKS